MSEKISSVCDGETKFLSVARHKTTREYVYYTPPEPLCADYEHVIHLSPSMPQSERLRYSELIGRPFK